MEEQRNFETKDESRETTSATSRRPMPQSSTARRPRLWLKLLIIMGLSVLLLIPQQMILNLVDERAGTMQLAESEVAGKWSREQHLAGPVICIPALKKDAPNLYILPETLTVKGDVQTQTLRRGIYDINVYTAPIAMSGEFLYPDDWSGIKLSQYDVSQARIILAVSDLRGLTEVVSFVWGGREFRLKSDRDGGLGSILSCPVDLEKFIGGTPVAYSVKIKLRGSEELYFLPVGNSNDIALTSNCATPSFDGNHLPTERTVKSDGFSASWKILALNRAFAQVHTGWAGNLSAQYFGVNLKVPVEQYQQTTRAVKYAFLIILLTFAVVLFVEVRRMTPVHPVQYLLVGLALLLFYSLLLSFSEHLTFLLSYIIASVMTIGLITVFMASVLKNRRMAIVIGFMLLLLYLFIYILLQLETFALLVGSVGLFIILALAMFASQKVNWYKQ